jgi:hypothetical protein
MTSGTHALLAELAIRGVSIAVDGNRLRLTPGSALTENLIERILAARAELLALLRAAPPRPRIPALPNLQLRVLWAVAQRPKLPREALYGGLTAPRPAIDQAVAVLVARGELRARRDGGLELNAS